eukprot:gnl/TRDRNA2_/TRDRNA2_156139_c1_seq1.p1 gnl/TRDRNA2_/TRDRNA2_156139_c1~~gnl/TRDRNA2_/TRDRNA2_156139_c1_seq1.p1  ORF type:complete len:115 (-),score=0.41 gnl/TRDRNA2_/TRDRNA2_156139_c1_seq1:570-914(-)
MNINSSTTVRSRLQTPKVPNTDRDGETNKHRNRATGHTRRENPNQTTTMGSDDTRTEIHCGCDITSPHVGMRKFPMYCSELTMLEVSERSIMEQIAKQQASTHSGICTHHQCHR